MAEAPVVKKTGEDEAQEGAPRSKEGEAKVSPDAKRNELVGLAEGSLAGVKLILKALEGSSLDTEAEKIRVQADAKLEELKKLLAKLLEQKKLVDKSGRTGEEEVAKLVDASGKVMGEAVSAKLVDRSGKAIKPESSAKAKKTIEPVVEAPLEIPGEQKEGADFEKVLGEAGSWDELVAALDMVKGLVDVNGHSFPRGLLKKSIDMVRKHGALPDSSMVESIPKTAGLREKVIELINKDQGIETPAATTGETPVVDQSVEKSATPLLDMTRDFPARMAAKAAAASAEVPAAPKAVEAPAAVTPEVKAKPEPELPEIKATSKELGVLIGQLTAASHEDDLSKPEIAKTAMSKREAIAAAAAMLGMEELTAALNAKRGGVGVLNDAIEKAILAAEAQLQKKKEAEKKAEEEAKTKAEAGEKNKEREKALRDLLKQLNRAIQDPNDPDGAGKKAALAKAAEVLGDDSFTKAVTSKDKNGSELVNAAIERAVKEAEDRLRGGSKKTETPPPGGDKGVEVPPTDEGVILVDGPEAFPQPPVGPQGPDQPPIPPGGGDKGPELPPGPPGQEGGAKTARLRELSSDYANKEAIYRKEWGGIRGWIRHKFNPKGFAEVEAARIEALKAYQAERAEQVAGSVDKMCDEQIALATEMAKRMSEKKRLGILSNIYDGYKKLGDIKLSNVTFGENSPFKALNKITQSKFGKILNARMAISLGLCGVGLALSGAALPIGFLATRRIVGGSMLAFGKFDALTKGAEVFEPDIKLSPANQQELNNFKSEQKLGGFRRRFNKVLGTGEKDKLYKEKFLEISAREAPKLTDEDLEKAITYFEGNNVFFGKDPAQNKSYIAFMSEKRRRMKGMLEAVDSGVEGEKGEAQKKYAEATEAKKQELMQSKVTEVVDYIKQWYLVDAKLFEAQKNVAVPQGTPEEMMAARKLTPEYLEWKAEEDRGLAMLASLPDEVQVALAAAQGSELGKREGMRSLLDLKTADELYKGKAEDIDPLKVAESDWQLNASVEKQIRDILGKDPKFNEEAEAAMRADAEELIKTVGEFEKSREQKKQAVFAALEAALNKHDDDVDKRIVVAVKRDAYRKIAALAAGIFVASGGLGKLLSGGYHVLGGGEGTGAAAAIVEQKGGGGSQLGVIENTGEPPAPVPEGPPIIVGGGDEIPPVPDPGPLDYCNPDDYPEAEPTIPTPDAPVAEGMYGQGDGVIHVARKFIQAGIDPELFEGMNDKQMQKAIIDSLIDYDLPNGKKAVVDLGNGLFHYNFMPHAGGMVKFLADENGHFKGLDLCVGDKVNMLNNGVDIATKGMENIAEQGGDSGGRVGDFTPDRVGPDSQDVLAEEGGERVEEFNSDGADVDEGLEVGSEFRDFSELPDEGLELGTENGHFTPLPDEGLAVGLDNGIVTEGPDTTVAAESPDLTPDIAPEEAPGGHEAPPVQGRLVEQGGWGFHPDIDPTTREGLVRVLGSEVATRNAMIDQLTEYQHKYGGKPGWNKFVALAQGRIQDLNERIGNLQAAAQTPGSNLRAYADSVGTGSETTRAESALSILAKKAGLLSREERAGDAFDRLDDAP